MSLAKTHKAKNSLLKTTKCWEIIQLKSLSKNEFNNKVTKMFKY